MEKNIGKPAPNGQIQQKHKNGFIGSRNSEKQPNHGIPHRSILQNHERNPEEWSKIVLENEKVQILSQEGESNIPDQGNNHACNSELVAEVPHEEDHDHIVQHDEEHDEPGDDVGGVHYKFW